MAGKRKLLFNKKPRGAKKKKEFKKVLVSIIIGFVAVAFVGSFAYNYAARRGRANYVAVVNGEPISMGSDSLFANLYRNFYEQERQQAEEEGLTEEKNREILRRALDAAIQRTLILQYAEKQGIEVAKETVLASIVKKGYYASPEKSFDEERYRNTPEADKKRIFQSEKKQLTIELFLEEHFNSVKISEPEIKSFYQFLDYGKKIEYVVLRYTDIPEDKLLAFYQENPRLFEQAHAAHILIKEDKQKAEEILKKVRNNPEKFSEIAREVSEDTTAEKGGDLGWFYRKDMVPEFSEAAFKLKKGKISDIVTTVFGYHIIKALDDVKIKPFEEALYRVKREYVEANREEVEKKVGEKTRQILQMVSMNPEKFSEAAKEYGLTVTTTDFITVSGQYILDEKQSTPLFELMNTEELINIVFSTPVGSIGGPVQSSEGQIIFRVLEEKKFDQEELEKSRDYITRVYNNIKENNLFNDWYIHTLRNSKIVDNFNEFFPLEPQQTG